MPRVSRVKLGERAGRDPFEHLLRKDPKELPPDVEGFEYRPVIAVQFVFSGFVDLLLWELHTFSNFTIQPS